MFRFSELPFVMCVAEGSCEEGIEALLVGFRNMLWRDKEADGFPFFFEGGGGGMG